MHKATKRSVDEQFVNLVKNEKIKKVGLCNNSVTDTLDRQKSQVSSVIDINLRKKTDIKVKKACINNEYCVEPFVGKVISTPSSNLPFYAISKNKKIQDTQNSSLKDTNNLFSQLKHSICSMSDDVGLKRINISNPTVDCTHLNSNDGTDKKNISNKAILERDIENCSFGTAIRQALIKNSNNGKSKIISDEESILGKSLTLATAKEHSGFLHLGNFYDLPDKVKDLLKQYRGIDELYDWQHECLNQAIGSRKNLIYSLPTSGGKTLVAEILMLREVLCYEKNAIFVLPYVAIVQEKVWEFSPFAVALDFLIEEYASSKGIYPPRKRRRKHSIYIATIEKTLGLINSLIETSRLDEIGLIVVDELHLIGESSRGAVLESCLTKIMFLQANIRIIGMSATLGNIEDICNFLKADIYVKNFRPVELTEYIKFDNQMARINWKCKDENDLFVDVKELDYKYSEKLRDLDPDMIAGLALEIIPNDSCLIFCPTKKNCENVVYILCRLANPTLKQHKQQEKEQLLNALKAETGQVCDILKMSLPYGIAYHHSGLMNEERHLLEEAFRSGTISIICCTSTLAAGVNLPARRVIVRSPYIGRAFISLSNYKQMVGRAGRTGLGEIGESIIVVQSADLQSIRKLFLNPMNQALSGLHEMNGYGLEQLLLSCISLGIANTIKELETIIKFTLMAVQEQKLSINVKHLNQNVIKSLYKRGALKQDHNNTSKYDEKESLSTSCNVSLALDASMQNVTKCLIQAKCDLRRY